MKTADLFRAAKLPVRAAAIEKNGPEWLARMAATVLSWAADAKLNITTALKDDLGSRPNRPAAVWTGDCIPNTIALVVPNSAWWAGPGRAGQYKARLQSLGFTVDIVKAGRELPANLAQYQIVLNHALAAPIHQLDQFATQRPGTRVVHVNHSSLAYLEHQPGALKRYLLAAQSAARMENVWCVSQDENALGKAMNCDRVRQVPMPIKVCSRKKTELSPRPSVALAGRTCPIKNHLNSIVAARLARVHLHVCVDLPRTMQQWIETLNS